MTETGAIRAWKNKGIIWPGHADEIARYRQENDQ